MKAARIALLALVCRLPLAASAQWMWLDKGGRKVFSDQPPPAEVAPERILKQPRQRNAAAGRTRRRSPTAAAPAARLQRPACPRPRARTRCWTRRRSRWRPPMRTRRRPRRPRSPRCASENCSRAKSSKANYESGVRLSRLNDKGEHESWTTTSAPRRLKVLSDVIARDCRQASVPGLAARPALGEQAAQRALPACGSARAAPPWDPPAGRPVDLDAVAFAHACPGAQRRPQMPTSAGSCARAGVRPAAGQHGLAPLAPSGKSSTHSSTSRGAGE